MKTLLISTATPNHHVELQQLEQDFATYSPLNTDYELLALYEDDDGEHGRTFKTNFANLTEDGDYGNVWWIDSDHRIGGRLDLPAIDENKIAGLTLAIKSSRARYAERLGLDNYLHLLEEGQHFLGSGILGFHSLSEAKAFCTAWRNAFDGHKTKNGKLSDEPSMWIAIAEASLEAVSIGRAGTSPFKNLMHTHSGAVEIPSGFFGDPPPPPPEPEPEPVPSEVLTYKVFGQLAKEVMQGGDEQMKSALTQAGTMTNLLMEMTKAAPEEQIPAAMKPVALNEIERTQTIQRAHPFIDLYGPAFGYVTEEEKDQFFIRAQAYRFGA